MNLVFILEFLFVDGFVIMEFEERRKRIFIKGKIFGCNRKEWVNYLGVLD